MNLSAPAIIIGCPHMQRKILCVTGTKQIDGSGIHLEPPAWSVVYRP